MNFRKAREVQVDGKGINEWNYTNHNDNQKITYAIGYCAKYIEPVLHKDGGFFTEEQAEEYKKRKDKYHGGKYNHATPEEACACYKQYMLDTTLKFWKKPLEEADTHYKCVIEGCKEMTASMASVGAYDNYHLCEDHLNREEVGKLFSIGESFGS